MSPFLALGAACCWGVGDFFGGLMSRRQSVLAVVWISQIVGLIAVAVVVVARGNDLPHASELLWALAAGVFTVGTLIGFFGGMARGPMSLVAPISATGVSIPVLVGIAGGERPSAHAAGMLVRDASPHGHSDRRALLQRRTVAVRHGAEPGAAARHAGDGHRSVPCLLYTSDAADD